MAIIKGVGEFFGLDIGATAVRVVQLSDAGNNRWNLRHYGYAPIDIKTSSSDSDEARNRLGEIIMTAVGQSSIKTKNVVIGLSSNKSYTTVIDLPQMSPSEIGGTIKYQLDKYIPIAVDQAKTDWALLGQSLHDPSMQEVLVASTTISYAESRLELVEGLGFDVIAAEPDSLAMIRSSYIPSDKAQVIVSLDEQLINVAVVYGDTPRLVRTIPNGLESLVRAVVQNLGVEEGQARQFILKFGLDPTKLEGKVATVLESTMDSVASDILKSIKFFQSRYPSIQVGSMLLVGYAGIIPGFNQFMSKKVDIQASATDPWQRVNVAAQDPNLALVASEFAVAIGLAQRSGKV